MRQAIMKRIRERWYIVALVVGVVIADRWGLTIGLPGDPRALTTRLAFAGGTLASVAVAVLVGKLQALEQRVGLVPWGPHNPTRMSWQWWLAAPLWAVLPPGTLASACVLCWGALMAADFIGEAVRWQPVRSRLTEAHGEPVAVQVQ